MPAEEAGRLLKTTSNISAIGGSVLGPYLMAKALALVELESPWLVKIVALLTVALAPMVFVWLDCRRS